MANTPVIRRLSVDTNGWQPLSAVPLIADGTLSVNSTNALARVKGEGVSYQFHSNTIGYRLKGVDLAQLEFSAALGTVIVLFVGHTIDARG